MNDVIKYIILFIALIFVQIVVLNNILFFGYINPLLYILFVIIYPLKRDRGLFIIKFFTWFVHRFFC